MHKKQKAMFALAKSAFPGGGNAVNLSPGILRSRNKIINQNNITCHPERSGAESKDLAKRPVS